MVGHDGRVGPRRQAPVPRMAIASSMPSDHIDAAQRSRSCVSADRSPSRIECESARVTLTDLNPQTAAGQQGSRRSGKLAARPGRECASMFGISRPFVLSVVPDLCPMIFHCPAGVGHPVTQVLTDRAVPPRSRMQRPTGRTTLTGEGRSGGVWCVAGRAVGAGIPERWCDLFLRLVGASCPRCPERLRAVVGADRPAGGGPRRAGVGLSPSPQTAAGSVRHVLSGRTISTPTRLECVKALRRRFASARA